MASDLSARAPEYVVWDMTYACPLRCMHCYSESGRRASRQLGREPLLRVTDALISMQPKGIVLSGGEPLLVEEVFEVAERIHRAGIQAHLYTSGWLMDRARAEAIMSSFFRVIVSVDGPTAELHDRIRGRAGSFERALSSLTLLDEVAAARSERGERVPRWGIDVVVVRSNFDHLEAFCTDIVPRFPRLGFIAFGAVIPSGLATRPGFVERELLSDSQATELNGESQAARLQSLVPASVKVFTSDNRALQMHPDLVAAGVGLPGMQVEPDGKVRAMSSYEGTVGSLLEEEPMALWSKAVAQWREPFVQRVLTPARTLKQWAEATRQIDLHFGSKEVRARIGKREPGLIG